MSDPTTTPVELSRAEIVILIQALHPLMLEKARVAPYPSEPLAETQVLIKLHDARNRFILKPGETVPTVR